MLTRIRKVLILLCMILLFSVGAISNAFAITVTIEGSVGEWQFDEGSGNVAYDLSYSGNNGTIYGATWTNGKLGSALSFDAVNDYVEVPNSASLNLTDEITVEAWIKPNMYPPSGCYAEPVRKEPQYLLMFNTNGTPSMYIFINGRWKAVHCNYVLSLNNWHHVVGTYDGSYIKIYVNGELKNSVAQTGLINTSSNPLRIGYWKGGWANGKPFNGTIDEVKIYNYALSQEEILEKYKYDGLIASWNLDENGGNIAYDKTDNNNDGNIYDASWKKYGFKDSALSFDGVNDYVEWNYTGDTPKNDFTIEAWIKPTQTHEIDTQSTTGYPGVSGQRYLFWPSWGGSQGAGAGISIGTNGVSVYEHGHAYMPAVAVYNGLIGTDWTHVVVTYTYKQPKIYVNGNLVRTGLTSPRQIVYAPTRMGGGVYGYFNGLIDEVKIYDRALSKYEIKKNYKSLSTSLVSHWSFNENTGDIAYDYGSNNNNATRCYSASWTSSGKFSSAMYFYTSPWSSYVEAPNSASLNMTDEITVEAWIKPNSYPSTGYYAEPVRKEPQYLLMFNTNGTPSMYIFINGGWKAVHCNYVLSLNNWQHVVGTYDGSYIKIYVNGELKNSVAQTGLINTSVNPLRIGYYNGGWNSLSFNGAIDEVKIYKRALTENEVLEEYNLHSVSAVGSSIQEWNGYLYGYNYVADRKISTRWSSLWNIDPQWIYIDFGTPITFNTVKLNWEAAYAKKYLIQIDVGYGWETIYEQTNGNGGVDEIFVGPKTARYVRMYGEERSSIGYGYSLWEFIVYK